MAHCEYNHTQKGILQPILLAVAAILLAVTCVVRESPPLIAVFLPAVICVFVALSLGTLTVRDDGDRLAVRFGPLPVFKKTIPYADMTGVERDRSTFLAGWGIHRTRKGWLWNIAGFDCVRIVVDGRSTLIGTDDPDGLVAFLRSRLGTNGKDNG
jgi:hypothetical protein